MTLSSSTVQPTAACIDSYTLQSTPESDTRAGYDGAKRRKGSKIHIAVDTLGHLLALLVTPAAQGVPHSIRVDRTGNIWTVDAASSTVIKYSPRGRKLMTINVSGQPENGSPFNGTTDIAFAQLIWLRSMPCPMWTGSTS